MVTSSQELKLNVKYLFYHFMTVYCTCMSYICTIASAITFLCSCFHLSVFLGPPDPHPHISKRILCPNYHMHCFKENCMHVSFACLLHSLDGSKRCARTKRPESNNIQNVAHISKTKTRSYLTSVLKLGRVNQNDQATRIQITNPCVSYIMVLASS